MISQIQSLMNMEMQLYGGVGMNNNAPSYLNNYQGVSNLYSNPYMSPAFNGYNYNYNNLYNQNNAMFGQTIPQGYIQQAQAQNQIQPQVQTNAQEIQLPQSQPETIFQGLTQAEQKALVNTYSKGLQPVEKVALSSGIVTAITMNPRVIAHPKNTLKTFFSTSSDTNKMFNAVKENGQMTQNWKENAYIMEEAFAQMNRTECRSKRKLGMFRKQYSTEEYNQLKKLMEEALKKGEIDEIAKATETLRHAQADNGWLAKIFEKKDKLNITNRINDTETIAKNTKLLLDQSKGMTFSKAWNRVGGKWGLVWGASELLFDINNITTAFKEDTATGFKQLGQSALTAGASATGWQLGEALGVWGATKITPTISKKIGGKWGTLIGALARPVCAFVTSCLSRKAARAIVGENVANKIIAEQTAQTNDGQQTIVKDIISRMQSGEQIDMQTQQAMQKLVSIYA